MQWCVSRQTEVRTLRSLICGPSLAPLPLVGRGHSGPARRGWPTVAREGGPSSGRVVLCCSGGRQGRPGGRVGPGTSCGALLCARPVLRASCMPAQVAHTPHISSFLSLPLFLLSHSQPPMPFRMPQSLILKD